jgi:CRISPR/Cas system Type II protein with McrA/HNH and RuvC-like nuclease domain
VVSTVQVYKPSPQARYLVDQMTESEKHVFEAVGKLSEKMDMYDKRLTAFGSEMSKVQSQVDLAMKSIQVLQKEQVVLLKSINNQGTGSRSGSMESTGVMGSSPLPGGSTVSPTSQPSPPLPQP